MYVFYNYRLSCPRQPIRLLSARCCFRSFAILFTSSVNVYDSNGCELTKTSKHSIFLLFCFSATFQYDFFCMRVFPTITDRVYYLSQLRWHHWFPDIRWHGRAKTFSVAYCTGGSKIPNRPHKMHFINNCAILFLPKLSDLYGRDPVTVLNFSK